MERHQRTERKEMLSVQSARIKCSILWFQIKHYDTVRRVNEGYIGGYIVELHSIEYDVI